MRSGRRATAASAKPPAWEWTIRRAGPTFSVVPLLGGVHPAAAQYVQHNLISDQAGQAPLVDHNLINAWGGPEVRWSMMFDRSSRSACRPNSSKQTQIGD